MPVVLESGKSTPLSSLCERSRQTIELQPRRGIEIGIDCDHDARQRLRYVSEIACRRVRELRERCANRRRERDAPQPPARGGGSLNTSCGRQLSIRKTVIHETRREIRRQRNLARSAEWRASRERRERAESEC